MGMNCLRNICGLRRLNRVPRCGKALSMSQRMDQGFLRCYGYVERSGCEMLAKRVYESSVRGLRRRGRLRKCWMDGEKETLERKGLNIKLAKLTLQDRREEQSISRRVRNTIGEFPV